MYEVEVTDCVWKFCTQPTTIKYQKHLIDIIYFFNFIFLFFSRSNFGYKISVFFQLYNCQIFFLFFVGSFFQFSFLFIFKYFLQWQPKWFLWGQVSIYLNSHNFTRSILSVCVQNYPELGSNQWSLLSSLIMTLVS